MKDTVFLKSRKRGITVAMAVTMILIIALITTTVTISVVKTVKGSNLKAFATELSLVQNTIQEFAFSGSINEYLSQDVTLTVTGTGQFEGETITSNTVLLHVLDLSKMGIEKSIYGTGKNGNTKDYYAVSLDTMKVYYIAGYDSGDKVYYSLVDELVQILNGENKAVYMNNVIFKPNTVMWTNTYVTVKVMVPTRISSSTVTVSTNNSEISISSATTNGEYNEYIVNTGNVTGNYVVTVNYTLDGSAKTETYAVSNFDNEAPTIIASNVQFDGTLYYLKDIKAVDNGRIKKLKYVDADITKEEAYDFFKAGGRDLSGEKIKLTSFDSKCTIYAEDFAGNYTIDIVTVPKGFYYVGGRKYTGVVISDNVQDKNRGVGEGDVCVGNQFVWVPVDGYTKSGATTSHTIYSGTTKERTVSLYNSFTNKFKRGTVNTSVTPYQMTGTLDSTYAEPYSTSSYTAEQTEYYEMMESVQEYGGFYIARFEAGDGDATDGTNNVEQKARSGVTIAHRVVSKKNAYAYNYVPWGESMTSIAPFTKSGVENVAGAVYLSQHMYENHESVVSTLCYGVQWDATMNFVSDSTHDILNSTSWGNYSDNTVSGHGSVHTTGYSEEWKAKNIYDLAGNVREWTMEARSSEYRVRRGGYCGFGGSSDPAFYRTVNHPFSANVGDCFRPALYIKVNTM